MKRTRLATMDDPKHAVTLSHFLSTRLLPRRGYERIYAEGNSVFLEHSRARCSGAFNMSAAIFIAGFKAALSCYS